MFNLSNINFDAMPSIKKGQNNKNKKLNLKGQNKYKLVCSNKGNDIADHLYSGVIVGNTKNYNKQYFKNLNKEEIIDKIGSSCKFKITKPYVTHIYCNNDSDKVKYLKFSFVKSDLYIKLDTGEKNYNQMINSIICNNFKDSNFKTINLDNLIKSLNSIKLSSEDEFIQIYEFVENNKKNKISILNVKKFEKEAIQKRATLQKKIETLFEGEDIKSYYMHLNYQEILTSYMINMAQEQGFSLMFPIDCHRNDIRYKIENI